MVYNPGPGNRLLTCMAYLCISIFYVLNSYSCQFQSLQVFLTLFTQS